MAILSDYTSGTISVAANGTAVTGVGTAWQTAGFREGDWLIANGWVNVIASVNSNTSVTLAQPWRGGALSGAVYRMRYMSDGSRASAQARELINMLGGSGNLQAFGALAGVPNKGVHFTGAGTLATHDLTPFARTLLDDANATAARSTLELVKQTSVSDTTAGRLLTVGSFGIGAQLVSTDADLNNYLIGGNYITPASGLVNLPSGWPQGRYVVSVDGGQAYATQMLTRATSDGLSAKRSWSGVSWSNWEIVATVARGSNANGEWTRWGDGTQFCWRPGVVLTFTNASVLGATWTFPAAFASANSYTMSMLTALPSAGHRESSLWFSSATAASVNHGIVDNAGTYMAGDTLFATVMAFGRWF